MGDRLAELERVWEQLNAKAAAAHAALRAAARKGVNDMNADQMLALQRAADTAEFCLNQAEIEIARLSKRQHRRNTHARKDLPPAGR